MIKDKQQWYTSWFDTTFYHILYSDRDYNEAQNFMDNLVAFLNIPKQGSILDLACGKGRHAIYLNSLGYRVVGADLSKNSIKYAKQFENSTLKFHVHDMTKPFNSKFDTIFNLFTSFGYFENDIDNLNTIKAIKQGLNNSGVGVIDFMNSYYVIKNLVKENTIIKNGIHFYLKRTVINGYIVKDISFEFEDKLYNFQERVKAFSFNDFKHLFKQANVNLTHTFGNYNLDDFNLETSDRLILVFK